MKKIYLLIAILSGIKNFTQKTTDPIQIKSPESYNYEKRGNIPINKFSGTLDLAIPLYNIKVGNEAVQADLRYDSSGFQPIKKSGYGGLNWALNYSGVITRQVSGVPDDYLSQNNEMIGFLEALRRNTTNVNDYNTNYTGNNYPPNVNGHFVEIDSDKYLFNFWGVSGFFYIGNNGYPLVQSNDPNLTVDISNYSQQRPEEQIDCKLQYSEFIIIDGKGNKYFFGGNYNNLEISSSLGRTPDPSNLGGQGTPDLAITGWYLYKVELNDGNKIIYSYNDDFGVGYEHGYCKLKNTLPYKQSMNDVLFSFEIYQYVNQHNQGKQSDFTGSVGGSTISGSNVSSRWSTPYFMFNALKKVKLKKINIINKINADGTYDNNYSVDFNYSSTTDNLGYRYDYLSNIKVKSRYGTVNNIDFTILPKGDSSKRWFLTRVKKNEEIYDFEYYNDNLFPTETTFGIDFWGFWNGKSETNILIPQYSFSTSTGDITITGNSRDSSYNSALVGTLKKIIYPTKGTTEFFYEPNDYSYKIARNSTTNFLPELISSSGESSGIRIVKMIDSPLQGIPVTREYKYKVDRNNPSSASSGIQISLYEFFKYLRFTRNKQVGPNYTTENIIDVNEYGTNFSQSIFSGLNIEYRNVQEYIDGKLQKEYSFTNYFDYPNYIDETYGLPNVLLFTSQMQSDNNFFLGDYQKNLSMLSIDTSFKRGKIKKESFFKDDQIIREIETQYISLSSHSYCKNMIKNNIMQYQCGLSTLQDYTTRVTTIGTSWIQKARIYSYPFVVDRFSDSEYLINGNKSHNTIYNYEDNTTLNLTDIQEYDVDEIVRKTKFTYPLNSTNPHLINRNFLSQPLVIKKSQDVFTANGFINLPLSTVETKYDDPSNLFPSSVLSYDNLNASPSTEVTYNQYDSKGNLQQYTTKSGIPVAIVWGYNGTQPIAKIEGATYAQVQNLASVIMTASDTDASAAPNNDEADLLNALKTFRAGLPNYQVTTYTYDPLIGVRSITPPSGIREVYLYDTANRLMEIREQSKTGKLLKEFKYNYKN